MRKNILFIFSVIFLLFIIFGCYYIHSKNRYNSEINDAINSLENPPSPGSDIEKHDEEMYQKGIILRVKERIKEAKIHDGISKLNKLERYFSNFVGKHISSKSTPITHSLLYEVRYISWKAAVKAKEKFKRPRPFLIHPEDKTCLPDAKSNTNPYESYPSIHATTAWSTGLILAKIIPDKSVIILEQTQRLSDSRWICGYHWISDTHAAETMVRGIVRRLMQRNSFRQKITEARKEMN